jgi:hypothetical protein
MFKHAYVRGIQTALVNSGHAAFPDETTAAKVADYIADRIDIDPLKGVPSEATHKIASNVLEASNWIKTQPGFKAAGWNKLATWEDVQAVADRNAVQLMTKAAEGSTIEGGDKGNTESQSPAGETKMDTSQRPPGYATDSRGETAVDTKPGAVGKEEEQPNKPKETDSKPNSVEEQSKTSSLAALFRKSAEGSTIMGGDKGNQEMSSAEAKMDASQRPSGYATFGMKGVGSLGEVMKQVDGPAVVGKETAQPNKPAESPSGSNSVTEHSAKAAAEDPYIALFKKVAAEVHEYLPGSITEDAKIAAVRACMGMTTEEKAYYLRGLQKEAADKTASETADLPPGSRKDRYTTHNPDATHSRPGAYDGRSGNQGTKSAEDLPPFMKKDDKDEHEKSESKDEEKKEHKGGLPSFIQDKIDARKGDGDKDKDDDKHEEKKEASLRDFFRRINAAQRA